MDPATYLRMREVEDRHWWFRGRRRIVHKVISSLPLPVSSRILDAGCGTGGNLELLATFGNVTGVETDQAAARIASDRGIAKVLTGSLPDDMPPDIADFDLVVMTDVLEHIDADRESLVRIRSMMKTGAYLVLTVPAFEYLWGPHDIQHHHKRRYVARTLRRTIQESSLNVDYLSYFNTLLFPVVSAVRLMERLFPGRGGDDLAMPHPFMNAILEAIFASERSVVPYAKLPFGVSLLAVARKA